MFPSTLAASHLSERSFVRIADVHLDVPLYWQCWKLDSPLVEKISDAVSSAAADLRPRKVLGRRP
jgi:LysR family transcriptional regulator (chromosome initiation inhibitor)